MNTDHPGRKAALSAAIALAIGVQTDLVAQNQESLEEIVVTGSRIARRDFSAQSPIVTVDSESFNARTNVGLEATLNQLPQFTVAGTQASTSAASTPFPQATAAPGAATINLRGLGLNRSLVLLDGRRVQPVNGQLVVDLNTIPSAAIERVEVITGGAAAVYGADAIAGVVNFILRKDFEGVEFSGQTGISEEGDGEETSINGLLGAAFADGRGNVMIGADYSKRRIILGKDRDWVVEGWDDPGTNGGGIGSSNLSQMTVSFGNAPTLFTLPPGRAYVIDQNGNVFDSLAPLNPAHPYTGPLGENFKVNPDGALGYNDMFTDMLNALDNGATPRETFYDGYVVNAIIDAAYASLRSKAWQPVDLPIWRGREGAQNVAVLRDYDAEHVLLKEERILVTSHNAWYSEAAKRDMRQRCAEDVVRVLRDEKPHRPANRVG